MTKPRNVVVAQSGGPSPVINNSLRGVVETCFAMPEHFGTVYAGYHGIEGVLREELLDLSAQDREEIGLLRTTPAAGAIGTCRYKLKPHQQEDFERIVEVFKAHDVGYFFYIGGNDSMDTAHKVARLAHERGLDLVATGVPKTIDNDIWGTDITFGFDSALQTATEAIDKIHTTAMSHHRVMVVEIMGRYAGWLALRSGLAGGADVILIPEIPFDMEKVAEVCSQRSTHGKRFTIIAAGEGATVAGGKQFVERVDETSADPIRLGGLARWVAQRVEEISGLESRAIVLGHIQRGGSPTAFDRVLATQFGFHAFELLTQGKFGRLVVIREGRLDSAPIAEVAGKVRTVPHDDPLISAARAVGTSFAEAQ